MKTVRDKHLSKLFRFSEQMSPLQVQSVKKVEKLFTIVDNKTQHKKHDNRQARHSDWEDNNYNRIGKKKEPSATFLFVCKILKMFIIIII